MKDGEKVYATCEDCENWMNDCEGEAINEIVENDPSLVDGSEVTIYVGEVCKTRASSFIPTLIAEMLSECAYEEVGDVVEGWLSDELDDLQKEFKVFIDGFCKSHNCEPKFYKVKNVKPLEVIVSLNEDGSLEDWKRVYNRTTEART